MSNRFLHQSLRLVPLAILIFSPWNASGTRIESDNEASETYSLFEELFHMTEPDTSTLFPIPSIQTAEQAKQALVMLKNGLRERGDIAPIKTLAPRIIQILPRDDTAPFLYAITLAADGKYKAALDQLSSHEVTEKNRLYVLLVKSIIAKGSGQFDKAATAATQAIGLDSSHPYAYNLLGQIKFAQQQYKEAINNFNKAIDIAPQFYTALSNLGSVQFLLGDNSAALKLFNDSIQITAKFCPALIGRAAVFEALGNTAGAIEDLRSCININPKQLVAIKRLSSLYLKTAKLNEAEKLAEAANSVDSVFSHTTLAEIHLRRNETQAARELLMGITNKNAQTYYMLAFCDVLDGKEEGSESNILKAEELQPKSATLKIAALIFAFYDGKPISLEALNRLTQDDSIGSLANFTLANVYASRNDFESAYQHWIAAKDIVPGFILDTLTQHQIELASTAAEQKHLSLGVLLYLKNYYKAALTEFKKALIENHNSFLANFFSALTLTQIGESDNITKYLLQSIEYTSGFFPANYMLAEQSLKNRDIHKAIKYYKKAAESVPDQGVLIKLGLLHEQEGNIDAAEKTYQNFIDHHPTTFLGYNQLAWLYAKHGMNINKAIELATKANELRPGNASVNDTIGWIYLNKNDFDTANEFLQRANQISKGKNPDILYHLAVLHHKRGNNESALNTLEQALSISKRFENFDAARELLSRLK